MSRTPRQRAEACFAVARSTAHAGEREAAIGRGKAICERHGLPLDDFDIPGRNRARPERRSTFTFAVFEGSFVGSGPSMKSALEDLAEAIRRGSVSVGAGPDETIYDARRRNFDQACAEAKARDQAREARAR